MKFHAQTLCSLGVPSGKPCWKLENVVSTIYKTINNINIVFSNYFQKKYKFAIFFTLNDYIGLKCDHICKFKANLFSKDFGPGTFKMVGQKFHLFSLNGSVFSSS